jgi:hypothetical protein
MNCIQTTKTTNNWGQIMINSYPTSSPSEPKINCALTPIVAPPGVQFNIHSNNYIIERLSIRPLQAVEEHFDLVIDRKYLSTKPRMAGPVSIHVSFARFKKSAIRSRSTAFVGGLT